MVEYDYKTEGGFVVDYRVADKLWDMLSSAEFMNFGPDPPVLLVARSNYSIKKSSDSNKEWLFTRFEGENYESDEEWELIPARFKMEGRKGYVSNYFDDPVDMKIEASQLTSQVYTNSGAMLTFDFKQELGEEATGFIRIPVHPAFEDESEMGPWPDDFDYFHYQYRQFSSQWGNPPAAYEEYYHPHYSSKSITDGGDIVQMMEELLEIVEKSENRWGV